MRFTRDFDALMIDAALSHNPIAWDKPPDEDLAEHPVHHGRPDGRAAAAASRSALGAAHASPLAPRRTGRGVRLGILQQPALRAVALHPGQRSLTYPHRRLGQRRRLRRRYPHLRPLPAQPRLSHGAVGQDALLRSRPVARLRGTPDQRHLSGGLWLGGELGRAGGAPELVPQHVLGFAGRSLRAHQPAGLRRGGGVQGPPVPLRPCSPARRPAILPDRVDDPSARPLQHPGELLESLPRRGHPAAAPAPPRRSRTLIRNAC